MQLNSRMKLLLQDGSRYEIELAQPRVLDTLLSMFKHLQYIDLPFRPIDNPVYLYTVEYQELTDKLIEFGKRLRVSVDRDRCLALDQQYLNFLHEVYETNYDGNPDWLDFHEYIHSFEKLNKSKKILYLDYRDRSGLLEKPFDMEWIKDSAHKVPVGTVFICWGELGKNPYNYFINGEPNDIRRVCELAKPWVYLKPKLGVALEHIDFLDNKEVDAFNQWWKEYHDPWCQHWKIESWPIEKIFSIIPIGKLPDIDSLISKLKDQINPQKIVL